MFYNVTKDLLRINLLSVLDIVEPKTIELYIKCVLINNTVQRIHQIMNLIFN